MIEVQALRKAVPNGAQPLIILHELSFSIASGETVAIVGSSGSGQVDAAVPARGADTPSSGTVHLQVRHCMRSTRTDVLP